jgi:uncharacterized protein
MILETGFKVTAPAGRVWQALLDVQALAACLPGSDLRPVEGDSNYEGALRPTIGGDAVACTGTLRAIDVDEDGRYASAALRVHQDGGPAFATALLRGHVTENGDGARVDIVLDGRVAGPGLSEDVAKPEAERLLGELASSLCDSVAERASKPVPAPEPARAAAAPSRPAPEPAPPEPSGLRGVPTAAAVGAAGAAAVTALLLGRRKRRGAFVEIRYRW